MFDLSASDKHPTTTKENTLRMTLTVWTSEQKERSWALDDMAEPLYQLIQNLLLPLTHGYMSQNISLLSLVFLMQLPTSCCLVF